MVVNVVGAGLAGCEASFLLAEKGIKVNLFEMKPKKYSNAHKCENFAELVCSNSLKSYRLDTASGLLKKEMGFFNSLILNAAHMFKVPAGGALAVDREKFSNYITNRIKQHKNINVVNDEVLNIDTNEYTIIATGPLTSEPLSKKIGELFSEQHLSFFDAAAPIIDAESIDYDKVFLASRYDKGDADYLNCPMTKSQYEDFYNTLVNAETVELKDFEKNEFKVYEGCMPIEVMAKRGFDTLRYGPLKPVGLIDKRNNTKPFAVVQLRRENETGTMYNLVGFQTNLKFLEQKKVLNKITGLENVEILRYGVMHRNTFINSPKILTENLNTKMHKKLFFAGQITGVEGYMESAMCGLMAGLNVASFIKYKKGVILPNTTMTGALLKYITNENNVNFQPMSSNMGVLPPLSEKVKNKKLRYEMLAERSLEFDFKKLFEEV